MEAVDLIMPLHFHSGFGKKIWLYVLQLALVLAGGNAANSALAQGSQANSDSTNTTVSSSVRCDILLAWYLFISLIHVLL